MIIGRECNHHYPAIKQKSENASLLGLLAKIKCKKWKCQTTPRKIQIKEAVENFIVENLQTHRSLSMLNNNCNAFQQSHCIWKDYLEITSRGSSLPNRINSYDECPGNPESLDFTTQGFSLFLSLPPAFSHSFLLSVSFLSPSLPLSFVVLFLGVYNDNNWPTVKKIAPNLLKTQRKISQRPLWFLVAESFLKQASAIESQIAS